MAENVETTKVVIKLLTSNRTVTEVFDFFENVKNMEYGGALKSVTKDNDGWWSCESPAGKARIKIIPNRELGILDHIFVGRALEWKVFVRIVPNNKGSTTTWTFIKPNQQSDTEFEEQLMNFDKEISGWKSALEHSIG